MSLLKLSAPWVLIYRQINAMFAKDPDIRVVFDEENAKISLYAADCDKAAALDKILIGEYTIHVWKCKTLGQRRTPKRFCAKNKNIDRRSLCGSTCEEPGTLLYTGDRRRLFQRHHLHRLCK